MNTNQNDGENKQFGKEEQKRLEQERRRQKQKKARAEAERRWREHEEKLRLIEDEKLRHEEEKKRIEEEIKLLEVKEKRHTEEKVFKLFEQLLFVALRKILSVVGEVYIKPFRRFTQYPKFSAAVIFSLLVTVFFFKTIFLGQTYLSPDAQAAAAISKPLDEFLGETGKMPLWSPYIFCGMPSLASLMYASFIYMPGIVLLPISRLFSLPAMLSPALHYILAAMGVFVFLRRKGASFWPAILGGFAFMFTPYLITMQVFGHGSQMMASAYLPWVLWAVDRLLEKFSWRNLGLAGLMLGFQLQRGHVKTAYYSLMLVGLYVLYYAILRREGKRFLQVLGSFAGVLVLAGTLAAVLYLPLQDYLPYSTRGAPSVLQTQIDAKDTGIEFEYATQWSFSPREMMTFLVPSFYGFGDETYWGDMPFTNYPNYMGILVLILAIIAIFYRRNPATDFESSLFLVEISDGSKRSVPARQGGN